jgi:elongator complex protein 3
MGTIDAYESRILAKEARLQPRRTGVGAGDPRRYSQGIDLHAAQRAHPKTDGGGFIPKHALVAVYTQMVAHGEWEGDDELLAKIRMKPTRTLSGVTTVTVLTRFHPCPGECIFCPRKINCPRVT